MMFHLSLMILLVSSVSSEYYTCDDTQADKFILSVQAADNLKQLEELANNAAANMSSELKPWSDQVEDDLRQDRRYVKDRDNELITIYKPKYGKCDIYKTAKSSTKASLGELDYLLERNFRKVMNKKYRKENNKNKRSVKVMVRNCKKNNKKCPQDAVGEAQNLLVGTRQKLCADAEEEYKQIQEAKNEEKLIYDLMAETRATIQDCTPGDEDEGGEDDGDDDGDDSGDGDEDEDEDEDDEHNFECSTYLCISEDG